MRYDLTKIMCTHAELVAGGPRFSRICYGTWRLLADPGGAVPEALVARLEMCADLGLTTIDTAEVYGHFEVENDLGAALRRSPRLRDRIQLVSKCGTYPPATCHLGHTVAHYNASAKQIVRSAENSLRLLGTDRLELFLIHRPDWLTSADETAEGLGRLLQDGKILCAGVSNYNTWQVQALQGHLQRPLATNQVELSLFQTKPMVDGILSQCEQLRIRPMAWSPLGGGRLFRVDDDAAARVRAVCAELGPKYNGASAEALAVAWVLALPTKPLVIIGSNKTDRIRSASVANSISIERQDWYRLLEAAQGRRIP